MDIKVQKFNKIYEEYINDYNLIIIALDTIKKLGINYVSLEDISYFIFLFKKKYRDYQGDIKSSLSEFINGNTHILGHCPNDLYIIGSLDNINLLEKQRDIEGVLNHYDFNDIKLEYKEYLTHK